MLYIHQTMPTTAITPKRNAAQRYDNWTAAIWWDDSELIRQYETHLLASQEVMALNKATLAGVLVTLRMLRTEMRKRGITLGVETCSGCGSRITEYPDENAWIWVDENGSDTCGPANPMCRGDRLDPFHMP